MVASEKDMSLNAAAQAFLRGTDVGSSASMGGPSNSFKQSLWVNVCISAISTNTARVSMRLSRGEATGTRNVFGLKHVRWGAPHLRTVNRSTKGYLKANEGEIVESGDLYQLLERPNPEQTWNEFIEASVGLMYCCGRVHWLFDEMAGPRPLTLRIIAGSATEPMTDKSGRTERLVGWKFRGPHGRTDTLLLDECLTLHLFNPDDPHAGLAPRVPAKLAIVSDYNASLYNAAMFGNSAEPGGYLKTEATFNPEQDEQVRTTWNQRHRGAAKAKGTAFLWGGVDWKSVASTMAEMQFIEGKKMSREEICAAYRVPPTVAGFFGTSGDSSAYTDNELKRFWQDTEAPLLDKIAEAINVHLASRFTGNLEVWADVEDVPIFQELRRAQIDAVKDMHALGVPLADLNVWANLGLPDQPQHHVGFLPMNVIPVDQAMSGNILPPLDEGPEEQGLGTGDLGLGKSDKPPALPGDKTQDPSPKSLIPKAVADRLWQSWQASFAPLAKRGAAMLTNHYAAQGRKITTLLRELIPDSGQPSAVSDQQIENQKSKIKNQEIIARILVDVFGDADERKKFSVRCHRIKIEANELGVRQSLTEAGLTGETAEATLQSTLHNPRIIAAVKSDSVRIAGQINDSTRQYLRRQLVAGMEAGETTIQLADRVQGVMQSSRGSALRISRNTVAQSLSRARHEGRLAGGITHEVWLHSRGPGERRESHVAAEARYAADPKPIGDNFVVAGVSLAYPRDPAGPAGEVINCQCVAIGKRIKKDCRPEAGDYSPQPEADSLKPEADSPQPEADSLKFMTYEQMLRARAAQEKNNATDE